MPPYSLLKKIVGPINRALTALSLAPIVLELAESAFQDMASTFLLCSERAGF